MAPLINIYETGRSAIVAARPVAEMAEHMRLQGGIFLTLAPLVERAPARIAMYHLRMAHSISTGNIAEFGTFPVDIMVQDSAGIIDLRNHVLFPKVNGRARRTPSSVGYAQTSTQEKRNAAAATGSLLALYSYVLRLLLGAGMPEGLSVKEATVFKHQKGMLEACWTTMIETAIAAEVAGDLFDRVEGGIHGDIRLVIPNWLHSFIHIHIRSLFVAA